MQPNLGLNVAVNNEKPPKNIDGNLSDDDIRSKVL